MPPTIDPRFYFAQTGMKAGAPSYVRRRADDELETALRQGDYVNLLSSRKVRKSSLLNAVFKRLQQDSAASIRCLLVELTAATITAEDFYRTLARQLCQYARQNCGHDVANDGPASWVTWWGAQSSTPADRLIDFFRRFFLEATTGHWVIALDEIDCVTAHPFRDDLFAAIRSCQSARASDPAMERLTFLLAGVSTPTRLIKDRVRTPYYFGTSINPSDFAAEEASVLLPGLGVAADSPDAARHPALTFVLDWNGGHPYLQSSALKCEDSTRSPRLVPLYPLQAKDPGSPPNPPKQ